MATCPTCSLTQTFPRKVSWRHFWESLSFPDKWRQTQMCSLEPRQLYCYPEVINEHEDSNQQAKVAD